MISELGFQEQLQTAISENRLTLPTLPEVALRVREAVESEESTAGQVAQVITSDAALSVRLLQVANSPLYRGRTTIDTVQMAITRLGNQLVRNLVVSLAMKQIFQATSDALDRRLRQHWAESVQVAAISRALAQPFDQLDREQAMLAGLIHNIGALPILIMADAHPQLIDNESRLDHFLDHLGPLISKQILESWGFPPSLIAVAEHHKNYTYNGGTAADYVDIVLVARLQAHNIHQIEGIDMEQIPSFSKLGLAPTVEIINIEGMAEEIAAVENALL